MVLYPGTGVRRVNSLTFLLQLWSFSNWKQHLKLNSDSFPSVASPAVGTVDRAGTIEWVEGVDCFTPRAYVICQCPVFPAADSMSLKNANVVKMDMSLFIYSIGWHGCNLVTCWTLAHISSLLLLLHFYTQFYSIFTHVGHWGQTLLAQAICLQIPLSPIA